MRPCFRFLGALLLLALAQIAPTQPAEAVAPPPEIPDISPFASFDITGRNIDPAGPPLFTSDGQHLLLLHSARRLDLWGTLFINWPEVFGSLLFLTGAILPWRLWQVYTHRPQVAGIMYCADCGYCLHMHAGPRCPECGADLGVHRPLLGRSSRRRLAGPLVSLGLLLPLVFTLWIGGWGRNPPIMRWISIPTFRSPFPSLIEELRRARRCSIVDEYALYVFSLPDLEIVRCISLELPASNRLASLDARRVALVQRPPAGADTICIIDIVTGKLTASFTLPSGPAAALLSSEGWLFIHATGNTSARTHLYAWPPDALQPFIITSLPRGSQDPAASPLPIRIGGVSWPFVTGPPADRRIVLVSTLSDDSTTDSFLVRVIRTDGQVESEWRGRFAGEVRGPMFSMGETEDGRLNLLGPDRWFYVLDWRNLSLAPVGPVGLDIHDPPLGARGWSRIIPPSGPDVLVLAEPLTPRPDDPRLLELRSARDGSPLASLLLPKAFFFNRTLLTAHPRGSHLAMIATATARSAPDQRLPQTLLLFDITPALNKGAALDPSP